MQEIGRTWNGDKVFEVDSKTAVSSRGEILYIDPVDNGFYETVYFCDIATIDKNTPARKVKQRIYNSFMMRVGEYTVNTIDQMIDGENFEIIDDDEKGTTTIRYKDLVAVMYDDGRTDLIHYPTATQEDINKMSVIVAALDVNVEYEDFQTLNYQSDCTDFERKG